jgi:branched-chain amino acid transport system substrate-binding protein
MRIQHTLCAVTGIAGLLTLGAQTTAESQQPIRIGATMSQTGNLATQGVPASNGYRLCEKHVNEKGGLLGRKIEFIIHDDKSDPKLAIDLYEKLITEEKVDAVMGPYGSTHTEAVAPVTEKHKKVHVSPLAATTSIWEKGRRYIFMVLPPAELFLAGLIDIGAKQGFKKVAIIEEDALFPKAAGKAAVELAKKNGMEVVLHETYAKGTKDFSPILAKVKAGNVEVFGIAASSLGDFIVLVRQMKEQDVNVKMFGTSGAVAEFQQALGPLAEFTFGLSAWEPSLPNPGIKEFVEAYEKEVQRAPSFHAAGAYGSCQIFMEAAKRAGSLDDEKLRGELLKLKMKTIFSDYAVDERGYQTANKGLFVQWQDGKKVVVWPDELASAKSRLPVPGWAQR